MSTFFYKGISIDVITYTTGATANAPGYNSNSPSGGFPVVPTIYTGLQPNDFYYYYTQPGTGIQPVSSLCTANSTNLIDNTNTNYTFTPTPTLPYNYAVPIPPYVKSFNLMAIGGGGQGGGAGANANVKIDATNLAQNEPGGNGSSGGSGSVLYQNGLIVQTGSNFIYVNIGNGGVPTPVPFPSPNPLDIKYISGTTPANNAQNTTTTLDPSVAVGLTGFPGYAGNSTTISYYNSLYYANAGNGGIGGGGGYVRWNGGNKSEGFGPTNAGTPGTPGNTNPNSPATNNSLTYPAFLANYGLAGTPGSPSSNNNSAVPGGSGGGGAVQFIFLYD